LTTIYFCKLCGFECGRERDIRDHLFYQHYDDLYGVFEVDDDVCVRLYPDEELPLA
jgi:hypothetical protein